MIKNEEPVAMNEIVKKGWNLLVDNLGEADAARFIVCFERGKGDSVQEIKKFWGNKKIEEIHKEVLEAKKIGSIAHDEAREDSDVDVCIKAKTPDPFVLVHINEEIESRVRKHVDIVRIRKKMNPFLKERIEKEGVYV